MPPRRLIQVPAAPAPVAPAPVVAATRSVDGSRSFCDPATAVCELQDQILALSIRIDNLLNVAAGQNSLYALKIDLQQEAGVRGTADILLDGRVSVLEPKATQLRADLDALAARAAALEVFKAQYLEDKMTFDAKLAEFDALKAQYLADKEVFDGKFAEFVAFVAQYGADKLIFDAKLAEFDALKVQYAADKEALDAKIAEFDAMMAQYAGDKEAVDAKIAEFDALKVQYLADKAALDLKVAEYDALKAEYAADKELFFAKIAEYDVLKAEYAADKEVFFAKIAEYDALKAQYEEDKVVVNGRLDAEEAASALARSDINGLKSLVGLPDASTKTLVERAGSLELAQAGFQGQIDAFAQAVEDMGKPATDESDATGLYLVRDQTLAALDDLQTKFNEVKDEVTRERLFVQEITLQNVIPLGNVVTTVGMRLGGLPIFNGSKAASLLALALAPYGVHFLDSSNGFALSVTTFDLIAPVEGNRLKIGVEVVPDGKYSILGIDADEAIIHDGGAISLIPFNPIPEEIQIELGLPVQVASCFTGNVVAGKFVSAVAPGYYFGGSKVVKVIDPSGLSVPAEAGIYSQRLNEAGTSRSFIKCTGYVSPLNPINGDASPLPRRGYRLKLPLVGAGTELEYASLVLYGDQVLPFWEVTDAAGTASKIINSYVALQVDSAQDVKLVIEDGIITSEGQLTFGTFAHAKNILAFKHAGSSDFKVVELQSAAL